MTLFRAGLLALFVLSAGCVRRVPPPTEALDRAWADAQAGSTSSRTLAFAGFHALLLSGDIAGAGRLFGLALKEEPTEPWALYGKAQLALRVARPDDALGFALDLCERAPRHPLASAAARLALDTALQARSTDDVLLARVPGLLDGRLRGDAAQLLRFALAAVHNARGDVAQHAQVAQDVGLMTQASLVGPFSAYHVLGMDAATAPEGNGEVEGLPPGPFGALTPRAMHFVDGRFSLGGEPPLGDVYVLAADAQVAVRGQYALRTVSAMDHVAVLDGTTLFSRNTTRTPASTVTQGVVWLEAGTHRVVLRMSRERQVGYLTAALVRVDGAASQVTFRPAKSAPALWSGVELQHDVKHLYPTAEELFDALVDEAGGALARFVAVRDGLGRDLDGARALLDGLPAETSAPSVRALRADVELVDHLLPRKVSRGRATRELEAVVAKDAGHVAALLSQSRLALEDGRELDALSMVKTAVAAHAPAGAPALALRARIELQLGLDAQAAQSAREAVQVVSGHCEALLLEYDIARRRDAVAQADALLAAASHCSGSTSRRAEHLKVRGDIEGAAKAWAELLARDETQSQVALALVSLLVAQRKFDDAVALLARQRVLWPRNAHLLKALGDVQEHAGRSAQALAAREAALLLDGADLTLRRAVHREKTGRELLEEHAISTEKALKEYEAAPGSEEATSTFVLDAAAIRVFPDGSQVDRIHIIQKALDQSGVQDVAEVTVPPGAQVLKLRTLKPDGTTLEPEGIAGKDGVSLPGVQVGDLVELEYLQAHASRGPGQPGFTSSSFYFQVAGQPNTWSTYTVVAPRGTGLEVDAHNMKAQPPRVVRDEEVFFHEERKVPPFIPEPQGPPSGNEWLPFVTVGAGQRGNDGVVRAYADAFLTNGVVTHEVAKFAKDAAKDAVGLDAVRAVYGKVMEKLSGRDAGLTVSAAASASSDRGSRTWLLKASLEALGFPTRIAAVRTFTADPAPYRFPNEALMPYVCLRVEVPGQAPVWLDPLVRYAPFGELPEFAMGGLDAALLPEPGRKLEQAKTPPHSAKPARTTTLTLTLTEDGVLTGTGLEVHTGFDAAQLVEALEAIAPDQRDQALQGALARYFGGVDVTSLKVDAPQAVGAALTVRYTFRAPRFARVDGPSRLVMGPLTFPTLLGRRYLTVSSRTTPLFVDASERQRTEVTLALPKGWSLVGPLGQVKLATPWGTLLRTEAQSGATLKVEEEMHLKQSRVPSAQYEAFARFAGEVDLLQGRDLLLERAGAGPVSQ